MSNTYDCFAASSKWSKEGSYAYNLAGLQEIVWYSSLQRAALQPWSPKAEANVANGGGEGKQVFKKGKEMTAKVLQKSLHISFGIDLWEREDVWKQSQSDLWPSPNDLSSVEGNLGAANAAALPG